jgi:two-component system response regulator TrcR
MYRRAPIRVPLVDDERPLTNVVRMAMLCEGWEIDVAHDAAEAVDKYRAIMLRDFDPYTPTLFLTARDSMTDRVGGRSSIVDLIHAVSYMLRQSE